MSQSDIKKVRMSVGNQIGSKVKIACNRGRHKVDVTEGVISQTYPSIFIVEVENKLDSSIQKVSYSYTDVLTRDVRLQLI